MSSASFVKFEVGVPTEAVTAFMEGWAKVEAAKKGHCVAQQKSSFDFSSLMQYLPVVVSLLTAAAKSSSSEKKCPLGFKAGDTLNSMCPVVESHNATVLKHCPMLSRSGQNAGQHLTMDSHGVQKGSAVYEHAAVDSISDLEEDDDPSEDAEVDLAAAVASALVDGLMDDDGADDNSNNSNESEDEAESTDSADVVYGAATPVPQASQKQEGQQSQQSLQSQQMVLPDMGQMMQQLLPMFQGLMGAGQGFQQVPLGNKGPLELESQPQLDDIHTE